jgi:hypothetical protein
MDEKKKKKKPVRLAAAAAVGRSSQAGRQADRYLGRRGIFHPLPLIPTVLCQITKGAGRQVLTKCTLGSEKEKKVQIQNSTTGSANSTLPKL